MRGARLVAREALGDYRPDSPFMREPGIASAIDDYAATLATLYHLRRAEVRTGNVAADDAWGMGALDDAASAEYRLREACRLVREAQSDKAARATPETAE
jgi:hypothetical protein